MTTSPPESPPETPFAERSDLMVLVRGLAGAIVGGAVGYFVFRWLAGQGLHALALPGALLGLGAGLAARGPSRALGIVCAIAAVPLGVFSEWSRAPFQNDESLLYFVTHLHQMDAAGVKFLMLGLGSLCGWWFGKGR